MVFSSDSSGDDDVYVSSASRLKALKKKPLVITNDDSPTPKTDDFWSSKTPTPISESTLNQNSNNSSQPNRRSSRSRRTTSTDVQNPSEPVVVDDDEDDDVICTSPKDSSLNISQDSMTAAVEDDNYNVDIKVKWKSRKTIRLELRKYESFQKIFQYFADLEGVSEKQILILKGNKTVHRTDTPASLDLKVLDFLEGGVVHDNVMEEEKTEDAENVCKIKVQMSTKQKINVDIKMDETFKRVIMTCAEQLGVAPSQIKLSFDGDEIESSDTPESLDLEQEACIDLRVIK